MQIFSTNDSLSKVEKSSFIILLILTILSPIFFLSPKIMSFEYSKAMPIVFAGILITIMFLLSRLKDGKLIYFKDILLLSAFSVPIVALISSLGSENVQGSLIGNGFEISTSLFISFLFILMFLTAYLANSSRKIFYIYAALFIPAIILSLFHLARFIFGTDFMSFGLFTSQISNTLGKWNDIAILFGSMSVLIMTALEFLSLKRIYKVIAWVVLVIFLAILAVVNMYAIWYLLGIFALIFLVYSLSTRNNQDGIEIGEGSVRRISITSAIVLIISVIFIIGNIKTINFDFVGLFKFNRDGISVVHEANPWTNAINKKLDINYLDVRLSWGATTEIALKTLKEDPVLGSGPNRFVNQWSKYKPVSVNVLPFWGTDFSYGVGFIPTMMVNTGILGIITWIAFFVAFIWFGWKLLFKSGQEQVWRYLGISSFFGSLFLWIMNFIYIPSTSIVLMTFILSGVFVAVLIKNGYLAFESVSIIGKPKGNFAYMFVLVVLLIVAITVGYTFAGRYVSEIFFEKGINSASLADAEKNVKMAVAFSGQDFYYRTLTTVYMGQISQLMNDKNLKQDQMISEFQKLLDLAEAASSDAVRADVTNYLNWLSMGQLYEALIPLKIDGAYGSGKLSYNEVVKRNPNNPMIYLRLAYLEASQGNMKEASNLIDKSLSLKPDYSEALSAKEQIKKAK